LLNDTSLKKAKEDRATKHFLKHMDYDRFKRKAASAQVVGLPDESLRSINAHRREALSKFRDGLLVGQPKIVIQAFDLAQKACDFIDAEKELLRVKRKNREYEAAIEELLAFKQAPEENEDTKNEEELTKLKKKFDQEIDAANERLNESKVIRGSMENLL